MILGRNPALWLALIQALLNALVVLSIIHLDDVQLGALNVLGAAIVGLVANAGDPTTAPTFALTTKAPGQDGSSGGTGSPPGAPTAGPPTAPTPGPTAAGGAGPAAADPSAGFPAGN